MLSNWQNTLVRPAAMVVLLAGMMALAVCIQAPAAHAAARSVGGPNEPVSCGATGIAYSGQKSLPYGYWSVTLYAYYDTYTGAYCNEMYAQTHLHLNPGAPHGNLYAELLNCSGAEITFSPGTYANGGGTSGLDYWATTPTVAAPCGQGEGSFDCSCGGTQRIYTPTRWA